MPFVYYIRVMFVRIIMITHSDRALFNLNALVLSLGTIVRRPAVLGTIVPRASTRAFKSNRALLLCVIIISFTKKGFDILHITYVFILSDISLWHSIVASRSEIYKCGVGYI